MSVLIPPTRFPATKQRKPSAFRDLEGAQLDARGEIQVDTPDASFRFHKEVEAGRSGAGDGVCAGRVKAEGDSRRRRLRHRLRGQGIEGRRRLQRWDRRRRGQGDGHGQDGGHQDHRLPDSSFSREVHAGPLYAAD